MAGLISDNLDKHIDKESDSDSSDKSSSDESEESSIEASPCSIEDEGLCVDEFTESQPQPRLPVDLSAVDQMRKSPPLYMEQSQDCDGVRNNQKSQD